MLLCALKNRKPSLRNSLNIRKGSKANVWISANGSMKMCFNMPNERLCLLTSVKVLHQLKVANVEQLQVSENVVKIPSKVLHDVVRQCHHFNGSHTADHVQVLKRRFLHCSKRFDNRLFHFVSDSKVLAEVNWIEVMTNQIAVNSVGSSCRRLKFGHAIPSVCVRMNEQISTIRFRKLAAGIQS